MRDMLPLVQNESDYLVQHHYFGTWPFNDANEYQPQPNEDFLNHLDMVESIRSNSDAMVQKYTELDEPLPIAFTEFNLVSSPAQAIELFNGLYTAEILGRIIEQRIPSACIWDWQNTLESETGGDHGLLAHGDPNVPDATPRPTYYTYALLHRAFGDTLVPVSQSDTETKVWASRFELPCTQPRSGPCSR